MARVRAAYLLMLSRLCAAGLWILRCATDIVSVRHSRFSAICDRQRDIYLASRLSHFTPGYYASVSRVDTAGGTVGYTASTSSVNWSGMTCNYFASDGHIESAPLD